jgi:DNA-binding CsgD family transcriptional regulator
MFTNNDKALIFDCIEGLQSVNSEEEMINCFEVIKPITGHECMTSVLAGLDDSLLPTDDLTFASNYPAEYLNWYVENEKYRLDPVVIDHSSVKLGESESWSNSFKRFGEIGKDVINVSGDFLLINQGMSASQIITSVKKDLVLLSFGTGEKMPDRKQIEAAKVLAPHTGRTLQKIRSDKKANTITNTQKQILIMIGQGLNQKQIAEELHCTVDNVKYHLKAAYDKLDVFNQSQAVVESIRIGIFDTKLTD